MRRGSVWPPSGLRDATASRGQPAHSEQTAAPQETLSAASSGLISAHKHSEETWLGVFLFSLSLSPSTLLFVVVFVSSGWLLGLDSVNGINRTDKGDLL